jgi:oxygen-dependent protoporphyrinogen oxidase
MQEFIDALAGRLTETSVRLAAPVGKLAWQAEKKLWLVSTDNGAAITANKIVLAAPAHKAAAMLETTAPEAARELKQIAYASTATVSLAYRNESFPRPPDSFGFVVPAIERRKILACTFSSLKYPGRAPDGHVLLRAFVGGSLQPELFYDDDAAMERNVREELAGLLDVTAAPLFCRIRRHPDSMPQYHVGHEDRIQRIEAALAGLPGLALAGSAYHGVGISDCVRSGEEAAVKLLGEAPVDG